jgi:hypothetical protein
MNNKKHWQKAVFSAFVIWTMVLNSFPVRAQDIVTSDDISGGSSVFAFRQSRKLPQVKTSFRNNVVKSPSAKRPAAVPKRIKDQANMTGRVPRKRTRAIDPSTAIASNNLPVNAGKGKNNTGKTGAPDAPPVKVANKEEISISMAGAAESYLDKNDLNNAVLFFQKAVELNPNNENAKLGLSEAPKRRSPFTSKPSNTTIKMPLPLSGSAESARRSKPTKEPFQAMNGHWRSTRI